jgi:acetyl esterase/lipase
MADTERENRWVDAELAAVVPGLPRYDLADVTMCRNVDAAFAEKAGARASGRTVHPDSVRWRDRFVPSPAAAARIPVRVYLPRSAPDPAAGLLFMHGGAFCLGDLDSSHERCLYLAAGVGCVVVNVDYRLAPEHPFPAALDDCWTVLRWMTGNDHGLPLDSTRIAVGGSSAGAGLAAGVCLMARDGGGPGITFQLLLFPVTDHRMRTPSIAACTDTPVWDSAGCRMMWRHYLGDVDRATGVSPYASPALADHRGLPPAFVLTAELDPLRDEGIQYGLSLLAAGIPTEIHQIPGAYHAFDVVAPDSDLARRAISDQIFALSRALAQL